MIALWFVPAFYEREIYSPYDYAAHWLGSPARTVTTALFVVGALLGQGVRLLLTAVVLEQISGIPLSTSIWVMGITIIAWTLLGGISMVIWTDLIQFLLFTLALGGALLFMLARIDGGWNAVLALAASATDALGQPASKMRILNLTTDPNAAFTLWTGIFANTIICLNAYGTDQMIAQRMFCCRGPRAASLAIISSTIGLGVAVLALAVGLALYAFYQQHPLDTDSATRVAARIDEVFPLFIVSEMPTGLVGLIVAGVFAAALSSPLAALSQTVVTAFVAPLRARWRALLAVNDGPDGGQQPPAPGGASAAVSRNAEDRQLLLISQMLIFVWGLALCGTAHLADAARAHYGGILNLALAMASYPGGALLATFMLALLRVNADWRGIAWSAPLSILVIFAISWHQPWAQWTTVITAALLAAAWLITSVGAVTRRNALLWLAQTAALLGAAAAACGLALHEYADQAGTMRPVTVAWPWNVPIGFAVAFGLGYALAGPRTAGLRHGSGRANP